MLSFVLLVRTQQAFQPPTRLLSHMQVMKMLKPYYPSDVLAVIGHEYIKLFMFTLLRVPIFAVVCICMSCFLCWISFCKKKTGTPCCALVCNCYLNRSAPPHVFWINLIPSNFSESCILVSIEGRCFSIPDELLVDLGMGPVNLDELFDGVKVPKGTKVIYNRYLFLSCVGIVQLFFFCDFT